MVHAFHCCFSVIIYDPRADKGPRVPNRFLPKAVGSMQLLYDETNELEQGRARRDALLNTESVKRGRRKTMIDSVDQRPVSAYA